MVFWWLFPIVVFFEGCSTNENKCTQCRDNNLWPYFLFSQRWRLLSHFRLYAWFREETWHKPQNCVHFLYLRFFETYRASLRYTYMWSMMSFQTCWNLLKPRYWAKASGYWISSWAFLSYTWDLVHVHLRNAPSSHILSFLKALNNRFGPCFLGK